MWRIKKILTHEELYQRAEKYFFLLLLIPLAFIIHLLLGPGIVMSGDFPVIETSLYSHKFFYTWTDYGSYYGFETLSRYPFLALGHILNIINIGPDIISKSLIVLGFFSAMLSFYFACIQFFRNTITRHIFTLKLGALIGSLFYAFNVWSFHRIGHWYLWLGYAILPIFFISIIYSFKNPKNWKYPVLAVLTWSIASSTPHMVIFYGIFYLVFSIFFLLQNLRKKNRKFTLMRPILLIISLYLVLNLYWIYPYVLYNSNSGDISIIPSTLVTNERTEYYSQHSDYLTVLRLIQDWWQARMADVSPPETSLLYPVWLFASFVFPILALSSLILTRNSKKIMLLYMIGIIGILLTLGTNAPLNFYSIFLFDFPLPTILQYLFRDPDKWGFLIAFAFSFLLSISTFELLKRVNKLRHAKILNGCVISLILTAFIVYVYPIYSSTSQELSPVTLPSDFEKLGLHLKTLNSERVFYILQDYVPSEWSKGRDVNFLLYQQSSTKPNLGKYPISSQNYLNYFTNSLLSNKTNNVNNFIYPLGTSYVIFNNDTSYVKHSEILRELSQLQEFENIHNIGFFKIFRAGDVGNDNFYLHIPKQNLILVGGLDLFSSLNYMPPFSTINSSLYFLDQNLNTNKKNESMNFADYLVLSKNTDDFVLSFIDEKFVTAPFDKTNHYEPSVTWSKSGSMDPLHGEFHPVLKEMGIDNWDFDYGRGLVITNAIGASLSIPIEINNPDKDAKKEANFNLFMRYLKSQRGGEMNIYLDDKLVKKIDTVDPISNNFLWEKIGSVNLTNGKHMLTLQNIAGFNSVNIFALIPDEELKMLRTQADNLLENIPVIHVVEAEANFYNTKGKAIKSSNHLLDENNSSNSNESNHNTTIRSIKGQFKVPSNADLVALEFLAMQNNTANSNYSLKNIKVTPLYDYYDAFTSDFERIKESSSNLSEFNHLNFMNEHKDLLSDSIGTNRTIDGNGSLRVDVKQGNFSYWGVMSTDYIPINDNVYYNLTLDVDAKDVKRLHLKVFYYDSNKEEINWDFVSQGRDGTYKQEYKKILLIPLGAKYIKLQVWISPNADTPSSYLLDNVELRKTLISGVVFEDRFATVQNVSSEAPDISVSMDFDNKTTKNINSFSEDQDLKTELAKRNSTNVKKLVTKAFPVNSNSVYNYTITVEMKNMNFLYGIASFRNSSDVVKNSDIYGDNASNGGVLSLSPQSEIITTLNIVKPSNYTIALKTKTCDICTFLKIGIESYNDGNNANYTSSANYVSIKDKTSAMRWSYLNNIFLKQGTYQFRIYSDSQTELDSIVIYSTGKTNKTVGAQKPNVTLHDLFNPSAIPAPAYISEYKKIDPTKYILYIKNATQPYTISFAEAYDPLWIARTTNGDANESNHHDIDVKINSVPLYSVVNGFHVNKTGNYTLIIEYQPQLWFLHAGTASLLALIVVLIIFFIKKYHLYLVRFKNNLRFH